MRIANVLKQWRGLIISVAVFCVVISGAIGLINSLSRKSAEEQTQMVLNAVKRAAVTCFAIEGRYPQRAEYLEEYYGLMYDRNMYLVNYSAFASNIIPDIRVVRIGDGRE
ncbi:MAG: hypothetical protein Q4D04_01680 [Clostridia bacterium]|nr:hypothetical protein [Clostridia bacterium]